MARIRSIKPEYHTHPSILKLSIPSRLLFTSLWGQADDEGRLYDQPIKILGQAFGENDRVNIHKLLAELETKGRILRYSAGDRRCIQIVDFGDHQRIDRPSPSRIPPPTDASLNAHRILVDSLAEPSTKPPGSLAVGMEGKGEEGSKEQGMESLAPTAQRARDLEFEALAEGYGIDWRHGLTIASRGNLNAALQSIQAADDCTPDEIRRRAAFHRQSELGTPTPYALAKHWAQLAHGPVVKAAPRRETQAGRMLALADQIGKGDPDANGRGHQVDDQASRALPGNG